MQSVEFGSACYCVRQSGRFRSWGALLTDGKARLEDTSFLFGAFHLVPARRELSKDGDRIRLGGRALDILVELVNRAGTVVSKETLIAAAWPSTFVEETSLRMHISKLRRQLGELPDGAAFIINVPQRGYCFVAPVRHVAPGSASALLLSPPEASLLPALPDLIGRASEIEALERQFDVSRFVTVVGPAGVGKTTLAAATAQRLVSAKAYSACYVALGSIDEGSAIPSAVATALGISVLASDPITGIVDFLRDRTMLLIIDNCEHLIAAVATLAERIVHAAPHIDLLATSREPILASGEGLFTLAPLEIPPAPPSCPSGPLLTYSAVRLFVDRAQARLPNLALSDDDLSTIAEICRRLDGVPLSIELVAAQIGLFGVRGLKRALDDGLLMTSGSNRTAERHQGSLRGALDWSYALLSAEEQRIFATLSVFSGPFGLPDALAIIADPIVTAAAIRQALLSLASKSLLVADIGADSIRYRLLHITRAYAADVLAEDGNRSAIQKRHAAHYGRRLEASWVAWDTMTRAEWLLEYGHTIGDVRSALEWAYSSNGDIALGASLTAAALPFGFQLSLIDEFKRRAQIALVALEGLDEQTPKTTLSSIRLNVALANIQLNTASDLGAIDTILSKAVALSNSLGVSKSKIEPLISLAILKIETGDYEASLAVTDLLTHIATTTGDPLAELITNRLRSQVCHWAGLHGTSRSLAEQVLRNPARTIPLAYSQAAVDRRVSMRIVLARTLWMQGYAEQASSTMAECLDIAKADSPFAICQALALGGCALAFWTGDLALARARVDDLLAYTQRFTLDRWHLLAECFQMILQHRLGNGQPGLAIGEWQSFQPAGVMHLDLLITVDDGPVPHAAEARARKGLSGWALPEILRRSAEARLAAEGSSAHSAVEVLLQQSLDTARSQNAPAWELRSATSLARLWQMQDRIAEAGALLERTLGLFQEGHGTADFVNARALLESFGRSLLNEVPRQA